jgi:Tfp pilus assembly protein PilF
MFLRLLLIAICTLVFAACGSAPVAPSSASLPWQDQAFDYRPDLVAVSQEDIFRLDPELIRMIREADVQRMGTPQRLKFLMALVFGPGQRRFGYVAGHSTIAAETWERQRGDCLSLTVLTYAVARAMEIQVVMQEVSVPALFDRRGQLDVVSQHVNALFPGASREKLEHSFARDVVIDFEPEFASGARGRPLSEAAILARYYNNIATEHLAEGRNSLAYAHYKAAIQADPNHAASYGNLAILYSNSGLPSHAEQMLRAAVTLADPNDVPLRALHLLLVEQGRDAEALVYERMLQARRERDPYHWIGLGVQHLQAGENQQAIAALEHARDMANNFDEVHRLLAIAYWRAGEVARANAELTMLAAVSDEARASKLRKKLQGTPEKLRR